MNKWQLLHFVKLKLVHIGYTLETHFLENGCSSSQILCKKFQGFAELQHDHGLEVKSMMIIYCFIEVVWKIENRKQASSK